MAEIDWSAVRAIDAAAESMKRSAERAEEAARQISQQLEPGYGGNGLRLIELLESATAGEQANEAGALRDMLESARFDLKLIQQALGVSDEPHQSLMERMVEAAKATALARGVMPRTETIQWIDEGCPDADETVLITLDDGEVVEGWFDGEVFRNNLIEDFSDEMIAWATWPRGARA